MSLNTLILSARGGNAEARLPVVLFDRSLDSPRREKAMARLDRCWSKQHHHLCHRNANGRIRITSRQSFLHRTLCKQFVELATESPGCEFSISPAIPHLVVWT